MGIRSLRTASISTGVKRSKVWDQSATTFVNTPPVTSGMTHWYDGSDSATMTQSSGNISAWAIKSPASGGPTVTQGTGANQPNLVSNARAGRSAVLFTAANSDYLGSTTQPSYGAGITHTVIFAGTHTANNTNNLGGSTVSWGTSNAVGAGFNMPLRSIADGSKWAAGYAGSYEGNYASSTNGYSNTWACVVATVSGASLSMLVNNSDSATNSAAGSTVSNNNEFFLGRLTNPWYSSGALDGYMGDLFIFNRVLTTQEKTDMYNWLKQKWAL